MKCLIWKCFHWSERENNTVELNRALLQVQSGSCQLLVGLRQPPNFTTDQTALKPWQEVKDSNPMFLHDVKYLKQKKISVVARLPSFISAPNKKIHGPETGGCRRHMEAWWDGGLFPVALRRPGCPVCACLTQAWLSLSMNPRRQPAPHSAAVSLIAPHENLFVSFYSLPYKRHYCMYFQCCATFVCVSMAQKLWYLDYLCLW